MTDNRTLLQSSRFVVTNAFLRTPRKTYKLHDIDYVQVKRPFLLLAVATSTLLLAWAAVFADLLYRSEWALLVLIVAIAVGAASRLGTLVVHSWSLRGGELEDAIIWDIATVRAVRAALDRAMLTRVRESQDTSSGKGRQPE
jgi:hypothetical protein